MSNNYINTLKKTKIVKNKTCLIKYDKNNINNDDTA